MSSSLVTYSSGDAQLDVPTSISSSHHPASTVDPHQLTAQPEGQQSQFQPVTWVCGGVAQAGKELTLYLGDSNGFKGDATYSVAPQQHDRPQLPPVPLQDLRYLLTEERYGPFSPLWAVPRADLEDNFVLSQRAIVFLQQIFADETQRLEREIACKETETQRLEREVATKDLVLDLQSKAALGNNEINELLDIIRATEAELARKELVLNIERNAHEAGWLDRAARGGRTSAMKALLDEIKTMRAGYEESILEMQMKTGEEVADRAASEVKRLENMYTAKIQRLQRVPVVEKLKQTLVDKDQTIVERNKTIVEKDQRMFERMAEKEEAIKSLTDEVAELKLQLAQAGVGENDERPRKKPKGSESSVCTGYLQGCCVHANCRFVHPQGSELIRLRAEQGINVSKASAQDV